MVNQSIYELMIILDTTSSMSTSLVAVKDAFNQFYKFSQLYNDDNQMLRLINISYGDYDHRYKSINDVVKVFDSNNNNFFNDIINYKLSSNGGDGIEALRTALYKANQIIDKPTGIIIISDACGRTSCIKCPIDKNTETLRSGTWSTIRKARKKNLLLYIL